MAYVCGRYVSIAPTTRPLFGWSAEDQAASCEGVPESTKQTLARFPNSSD